jgi:hypothetical protein
MGLTYLLTRISSFPSFCSMVLTAFRMVSLSPTSTFKLHIIKCHFPGMPGVQQCAYGTNVRGSLPRDLLDFVASSAADVHFGAILDERFRDHQPTAKEI